MRNSVTGATQLRHSERGSAVYDYLVIVVNVSLDELNHGRRLG